MVARHESRLGSIATPAFFCLSASLDGPPDIFEDEEAPAVEDSVEVIDDDDETEEAEDDKLVEEDDPRPAPARGSQSRIVLSFEPDAISAYEGCQATLFTRSP